MRDWDGDFRTAQAPEQLLWLKRVLKWIEIGKGRNTYWYEVKNRTDYTKYYFAVLKSLAKLKTQFMKKRKEAEGMIVFIHS